MQQEVKLRGLDGLKGLFLLVLMGVGIFQGDLLAGQLVPSVSSLSLAINGPIV